MSSNSLTVACKNMIIMLLHLLTFQIRSYNTMAIFSTCVSCCFVLFYVWFELAYCHKLKNELF